MSRRRDLGESEELVSNTGFEHWLRTENRIS